MIKLSFFLNESFIYFKLSPRSKKLSQFFFIVSVGFGNQVIAKVVN